MLLSGTLTTAVLYIMQLCDSIVAGHFIGEAGVAAINEVLPLSHVVTFLANIISIGSGILYSRRMGEMEKRRADEIFGQGVIVSTAIGVICATGLFLGRDLYFEASGVTGEVYRLAGLYYDLMPLNAFLSVVVYFLEEMVFNDGDEMINNLSYTVQIGGNILFSVILTMRFGMTGVIIGTIMGNVLGILVSSAHFFRKSSTLHFVWHLSASNLIQCMRFSIVDAIIYLCWAFMDYVLIRFVAANYGETGLVLLAVVVGVTESCALLDGVGLAVQPLLETYLGEKNHVLIKRLMRAANKAAVIEGLLASVLVFVFAKEFVGLFGITSGATLVPAVNAVRITSLGLVFCSMVAIVTSYYMLTDHVALSVLITVIKDGILYAFLPLAGALVFGETGMWAAFASAPVIALCFSFLLILLRYGKERFPWLLETVCQDIVVLDDALTPENCAALSVRVGEELRKRGYDQEAVNRASLFVEEIGLTILEMNDKTKKPLLAEFSLLFDENSVLIIERDSGRIFDVTESDPQPVGISSFTLSRLMETQKEKENFTTTGYNRNAIRFFNTT